MLIDNVIALKQSIEHWNENIKAETFHNVRVGAAACALCEKYYSSWCNGCPVSSNTGQTFCRGTPYAGAYDALYEWKYAIIGSGDEDGALKAKWVEEATKERNYLISLLPEDEQKHYSTI